MPPPFRKTKGGERPNSEPDAGAPNDLQLTLNQGFKGKVGGLLTPSEPRQLSTIAFGGPSFKKIELRHRPSFLGELLAKLAAGLCLLVKRLSGGSRAAHLAQLQNFDLELTTVVLDLQQVAHTHFTCRFGWLAIRTDPAQLTRP